MDEAISKELVDKLRAELAAERAVRKDHEVLIEHLQLTIAKLQHQKYGPRSEHTERLLDQLSLQLEEIEATVTEDDLAAEQVASSSTSTVASHQRKKPSRKPFADHWPRERVVLPSPTSCMCCGSTRIVKMGEDISETIEVIPRTIKVLQTVREKFTCRDCEKISQPPPSHVIPRGFAGPSLLAMIAFEKYGLHMPLNRQSDRFAHEGLDLSVSTMADLIGATAFALKPIHDLIEAHVFKAERLYADDTTVPVLAKHKTRTGRIWVYCRDDAPFGGVDPPAAVYYYSADRSADHPLHHLRNWTGTLQSDAYSGYKPLSDDARPNGPIKHAFCWVHGRRNFFKLADIAAAAAKRAKSTSSELVLSPICLEAVKRIDALFAVEREMNGKSAEERLALRQEHVAPLVADLKLWLQEKYEKMSRHAEASKAIYYMLKRWDGFTRFLDDGRLCLSNNTAERALRKIACGRKSWMFCGSDRGGQRAAVMYTLIATCRLNDIDPEAWLAYTLAHIADHPNRRLHELLPWNWKKPSVTLAQAA
jgi:transposase